PGCGRRWSRGPSPSHGPSGCWQWDMCTSGGARRSTAVADLMWQSELMQHTDLVQDQADVTSPGPEAEPEASEPRKPRRELGAPTVIVDNVHFTYKITGAGKT